MKHLIVVAMMFVPVQENLREHGVKIHIVIGEQEGSGSGVYVTKDTILTANHLFAEGAKYFIDDQHILSLELIKRDESKDLMLMKATRKGKAVSLGSDPRRLDTTFTVGYPMGMTNVIVQGRIADFTTDQLLIDTTSVRGMSGGGVYSEEGRLIGITSMSWGNDKFMVATSIKAIRAFLKGG